MELFENYSGDWSATVTMWMTTDDPPMSEKVNVHCEMTMNDLFFTMKYSGTLMAMNYEANRTIAYDVVKKKFESTFIDNMNSGINYKEGTISDDKKSITLTGASIDAASGKNISTREVISLTDNTHMKIEGFETMDGNERKTLETNLTKK